MGPGLWGASATFDRGIVTIDLAAKRLTRIELPPNGSFASENVATLSLRERMSLVACSSFVR